MNASEEIEKLKKEFVSLQSEEQRLKFDTKFRGHIASKTEAEKTEFAGAFIDSAKEAVKQANKLCNHIDIRLKNKELNKRKFSFA